MTVEDLGKEPFVCLLVAREICLEPIATQRLLRGMLESKKSEGKGRGA